MTAKKRWIFLTCASGMLLLIGSGGAAIACHIDTLQVTSSSCTQSAGDSTSYDCAPGAEITYSLTVSSAANTTKTYEWRVDGIVDPSGTSDSFSHRLAKTGRHEVKAIVTCKGGSDGTQKHSQRVFPIMPFVVDVTPAEGGLMRANPGEDDGIECGLGDEDTSLCTERYQKDAVGLEMDPRLDPDDRWAAWGGYVNGVLLEPADFIKAVEDSDEALVEARPEFVEALGFLEDENQQYGFDDFSFRNLSSLPDDKNMIWKAAEVNGSAEPIRALIPTLAPYTMDDLLFSVDPEIAQAEKTGAEQIAVTADEEGTGDLLARYRSDHGAIVGNMKVAVYQGQEQDHKFTLYVRSATKTEPGYSLPDASALKSYLNRIFLQGVREWKNVVLETDPLITDGLGTWDLDGGDGGDGCVEMTNNTEDEDEMKILLGLHHLDKVYPKEWEKLVLLVKCVKHDGKEVLGISPVGGRVTLINAEKLSGEKLMYVIAHELGHLLGLQHACSVGQATTDPGSCSSVYRGAEPDTDNIMHPGVVDPLPSLPRLRFWQWEDLRDVQP